MRKLISSTKNAHHPITTGPKEKVAVFHAPLGAKGVRTGITT